MNTFVSIPPVLEPFLEILEIKKLPKFSARKIGYADLRKSILAKYLF